MKDLMVVIWNSSHYVWPQIKKVQNILPDQFSSQSYYSEIVCFDGFLAKCHFVLQLQYCYY